MKRRAAILGATPAMVRWTVLRDCPMRDLDAVPQVGAAARQLGALVEWSRARSENRIHNGICWHENCDVPHPQTDANAEWMGFPESEVFATFGGRAAVETECAACPVNSLAGSGEIAGCHGVIPFSGFQCGLDGNAAPTTLRLGTGRTLLVADLAAWFETAVQSDDVAGFERTFLQTKPRWFGMWSDVRWSLAQREWAAGFFRRKKELLPQGPLGQFAVAVQQAHTGDWQIELQLLPPGFSDGQTWTLQSHCGRCGQTRKDGRNCPTCGEHRAPMPALRKKVLGLRPWLRLADVMGRAAALAGVEAYRKWRADFENGLAHSGE